MLHPRPREMRDLTLAVGTFARVHVRVELRGRVQASAQHVASSAMQEHEARQMRRLDGGKVPDCLRREQIPAESLGRRELRLGCPAPLTRNAVHAYWMGVE